MIEKYSIDYTNAPICPWCGHDHCDAWEWDMKDNEYEKHDCDSCGKIFGVSCSINISYCTKKIIKESKNA